MCLCWWYYISVRVGGISGILPNTNSFILYASISVCDSPDDSNWSLFVAVVTVLKVGGAIEPEMINNYCH